MTGSLVNCSSLRQALQELKDADKSSQVFDLTDDTQPLDLGLNADEVLYMDSLSGHKRSSDEEDSEELIEFKLIDDRDAKKSPSFNPAILRLEEGIRQRQDDQVRNSTYTLKGDKIEFKSTVDPKITTFPLHYAVYYRNFPALKVVLTHLSQNVNAIDSTGHSALSLAVALDFREAFDYLLPFSDINEQTFLGGLKLIHLAAMIPNRTYYLKTLIERGADLNSTCTRNQWTALIYAAFADFEGNFSFLCDEATAEQKSHAANGPLLHVLLNANRYEQSELCILLGFPLNYRDQKTFENILHLAAKADQVNFVNAVLMTASDDEELRDFLCCTTETIHNYTPIEVALKYNHFEVVKALSTEAHGSFLMSIAARMDSLKGAKFLVENGLYNQAEWFEAYGSELIEAYEQESYSVAKFLAEIIEEDRLYAFNEEGMNILQLAASNGDPTMVALLIRRGMGNEVENSSEDPQNNSALAWAIYRGNAEIVQMLLRKGANREEAIDPTIFDPDCTASDLYELAAQSKSEFIKASFPPKSALKATK